MDARMTDWRRDGRRSGLRKRFTAGLVGAAVAVMAGNVADAEPLVGVGMYGADGTLVGVAGTGDAQSSQGVAVSGTGTASGGLAAVSGTQTASSGGFAASGLGYADGGAAAVSGVGTANSEAVASVSLLGQAETGEGVAAVGGKNEIENVNVCSVTFCEDAFDDALGQYYAAGALVGVSLPFPADTSVCTGFCAQNHYQKDCPEIRDGTGSWRIMEDGWYDVNGCPIVLRYGTHRSDHDGWGWVHIQNKPKDWDWGSFTYSLTGQALGHGPRVLVDNGYILSCINYKTSGGRKRTWHVFVDYKGGKGITTVFYRTGHDQCRSS